MAKIVDIQITKLVWAPTVANLLAPTKVEIDAGIDLTPYMVTSYKVGFEGSSVVTEAGVADGTEINAPTRKKYSGNLVLYRDYAAGVVTPNDPMATFAGEFEQGVFLRRIGLPFTVAAAASQKWEAYGFTADMPQPDGGTEQGFLKMTVPLISTGRGTVKAVVAT